MSKNHSRLLFLLILIITLVGLTLLRRIPAKKTNTPFAQINPGLIQDITIVNDDNTVTVYAKNQKWYLKNNNIEFTADQEKISRIIDDFINISTDEIVSKNKKRHADFGIGKNKLIIKTNGKNYTIYLGQLTGVNRVYVRFNQENNIYNVEGFGDIINPSPFDYRDLNVYFLKDESQVRSFDISYDGNYVIFTKKNDKWLTPENTVGKSDRVDFFLNDLQTLKSTDILSSLPDLPLSPELTINIKDNKNQQTAEFYPVNDGKENYYLKTTNSKFIFKIPTIFVASLKKQEKDFTD